MAGRRLGVGAIGAIAFLMVKSLACTTSWSHVIVSTSANIGNSSDFEEHNDIREDFGEAYFQSVEEMDQTRCTQMIGKKIWYKNQCQDFDIGQFAPRFYLHKNENFYPSSVPFFLEHVKEEEGHLVSKQYLGGPESYDPSFLRGQAPREDFTPPVYALVVPKKDSVIDVIYWTFYPYNRGKRVCVGLFSRVWGGCFGKYKTFGNHVGDWEHVTIRFVDLQPRQIFLSVHSFGATHRWRDAAIQYVADHPILYVALGSHGLYPRPGDHTYHKLPNGDALVDHTSAGLVWDSWKQVESIFYNRHDPQVTREYSWLHFPGRWGNPKDGCGIYEIIADQCLLNSGPSGPITKDAVRHDELG